VKRVVARDLLGWVAPVSKPAHPTWVGSIWVVVVGARKAPVPFVPFREPPLRPWNPYSAMRLDAATI
jgi:hypothetical protein